MENIFLVQYKSFLFESPANDASKVQGVVMRNDNGPVIGDLSGQSDKISHKYLSLSLRFWHSGQNNQF